MPSSCVREYPNRLQSAELISFQRPSSETMAIPCGAVSKAPLKRLAASCAAACACSSAVTSMAIAR